MGILTKKRSYRIKEISNSLHKRLKILSAEKEITIQQAILDALEQYVSMGEEQKKEVKQWKENKEGDKRK